MNNPLLNNGTLPAFSKIKSEHIVPAIKHLLTEASQALEKQLNSLHKPSWESLYPPLEAMSDKINQAWSPISHLHGVMNDDELRIEYEKGQQLLTDYYSELGQNKALFEAYKSLNQSAEFSQLNQPQKQTINNAVRDFHLSGVDLPEDKATRFKAIRSRLSTLSSHFSNNVLDATQGWNKHIKDKNELLGLPDFILANAKKAALEKELEGYLLSLDLPVYITVQTQADNRNLRQEMYLAYSTRASNKKWDNTENIEEILSLRQELAQLLGFTNYSELSIAPKMAQSTQQVVDFLEELAKKSKPYAEKDLAELTDYALKEHAIDKLQPWDITYYAEKLKIKLHNISQEQLREYFPLQTVLEGLFTVLNKLFQIDIVKSDKVELWHEDASYYEISQSGKVIACFYLDVYARSNKRGGAWMDQCRDRRLTDAGMQLPIAYLVCNFNAPAKDKPALLTHQEVTTLFHEFGHGIHHMLTQIDIASVSGINGVAWDAVELPSQFMENFCWQPEVLSFLSSHYQSGKPLSNELINNMLAAKNFQSAMQMVRQIEFSLFDFRLHIEYGKPNFIGVQALLDEIRHQVAVIIPPDYNKFQHAFTHIFSGGYAAGYYSYKWAEVLSADVFAAFEEEGIFNKATGQRYLTEILQKGGSEDASILFKNFRGRDPQIDSLLQSSGLIS